MSEVGALMNELKLRNRHTKNGRVKLIKATLNQYNMLTKLMGGVRLTWTLNKFNMVIRKTLVTGTHFSSNPNQVSTVP